MQRLQQASQEAAEARGPLAGHQADAFASGIGDGLVLDGLVEVGDVAGQVPARGVVERPAQDERELGTGVAVLRHDAARGDLQQAKPASAGDRQAVMPHAEPEPPPSDVVEFAG